MAEHRAVVAWGLYARSCIDVNIFTSACVGCRDAHTFGVALIDDLQPDGCDAVSHAIEAAAVLPAAVDPVDMRYWPRTRALFGAMTMRVPKAVMYVKLDADTFFSVRELRSSLLRRWLPPLLHHSAVSTTSIGRFNSSRSFRSSIAANSSSSGSAGRSPPEYFGKELHIFSYLGRRLTYMQGGAYMLSRRAALAAAACMLGPWRRCPTQAFEDLNNRKVNAQMRNTCYVPQVIAEDLLLGTCMRDANVSGSALACVLTLRAGTVHPSSNHLPARPNNTRPAGLTSDTARASATDVARDASEVRGRLAKLRSRCACPIAAHPLKTPHLLEVMANTSRERGCAV